MLPLRDIVAWKPYAPWSNAQVEQDLILTRAIVAIFSDKFLASQVAMRGGTVLHKIHLAPPARYSEDIDLVAVGARPRGDIVRSLRRVLEPLLGAPLTDVVQRLRLAVRNLAKPSEVAQLVWEYAPTEPPPPALKLKVEINVSEREPVFPLVTLPYTVALPDGAVTVPVVSYDVNEMLGTKMRALLQRDKARDLFDLSHAWARGQPGAHGGQIQPTEVTRAFSIYMAREGTEVTRERFENDLGRKLSLASFRADISDVLAPDVNYDVASAAEVVRDVFLVHLPTRR